MAPAPLTPRLLPGSLPLLLNKKFRLISKAAYVRELKDRILRTKLDASISRRLNVISKSTSLMEPIKVY